MNRTFKYRVNANKQTMANAESWLNLCRQLYNACLEQRIIAYKTSRKSISKYEQMRQVTELRHEFPEYKDIDAQCLTEVVKHIDWAYQSFFRRVKSGDKPGFPRFKGRDRYDSFTLRQNSWKLNGKYLSIRNVGIFKLRLSRPIEGNIKTMTIKRSADSKWYVSFACDNVPDKELPQSDNIIGIDVGLESFATLSDGAQIENPRHFKKGQSLLKQRQQALSRKVKGSNRRRKARILVAKAHDKIRNQRRDFHYKTANRLIKEYGTICIEDMKAWNSFRCLNKSAFRRMMCNVHSKLYLP
ncbi:MAG: transposase [Dehalococcoidales bacterium]|nr:transposase [Dehalococcoidales bacterium]